MNSIKWTITGILSGLCAYSSMAQSGQFTLEGDIKGSNSPYIYFRYFSPDGNSVLDSVQVTSGKFSYRGQLSEPTMVFISGHKDVRQMDDPNATAVFLEPAPMQIQLETDNFKNVQLTGSKTQDEQAELNRKKKPIMDQLQPHLDEYNVANEAYMAAVTAKKPEAEQEELKEKAASIREKFSPFYVQTGEIDDAFIHSHPDSYLSAYLLRFKASAMLPDSAEAIFGGLTPRVQQSSWGQEVRKSIDRLKMGSPGSRASVFTTQDIIGEPLSLQDFRGQYVLLDFWASWCVPCRKGNPHLLDLYGKYSKRGFEIIGISDDDSNHDAWRKAVEKDGIGVWKHVLRGLKRTENGFDRSNDISDPYGIRTLPTKILIEPDGIIIGRYGGGGEDDAAMDKKLEEIFN